MPYNNLTTHLVYGVWLLGKDGSCLEVTCPEGRGLSNKILEKHGLVLVEFGTNSTWVLGIADSHQKTEIWGSIDIEHGFEVKLGWSEKLLAYCKRYRIKSSKYPKWRIVTYAEYIEEEDYYEGD
jgi:hypothetical protein